MSEPLKLAIKPQAPGGQHCLEKLNTLEWKVLPGTRQQVLRVCQSHNANAANIAAACLSDPLLCWVLSQQANTRIHQREKWPHHLEQLISLVGIPQVIQIIQSCDELSLEQLNTQYAALSRSIINSLLANEIFKGISAALNNDWHKQCQLSNLQFRLPEWALGIENPQQLLQLEVLSTHGRRNPERAQLELLGCRFSELVDDFCQYNALLPACRKAWQRQEHNKQQQIRTALQAFRLRQEGRPEPQSIDAQFLLIACHRLVSQLSSSRGYQQSLKLLSGMSNLSREQLQGILNNSMLTMPWHDSLSIDLHPMRWQHCDWRQQAWLPTFSISAPDQAEQASDEKTTQNSTTTAKQNAPLLKQCLKRLLSNQSFSSSKQLLEFTLQTFRRGLASKAAFIWVYNKGQLSCRHFYGLEESNTPSAFKPREVSSDICHRLLQKSAAIRLSAQHKSLSPELQTLLKPQQELAIMSILVGGKPAALLMVVEERSIDDEQFRLFKQLSHGFHQALLRQLQAK